MFFFAVSLQILVLFVYSRRVVSVGAVVCGVRLEGVPCLYHTDRAMTLTCAVCCPPRIVYGVKIDGTLSTLG